MRKLLVLAVLSALALTSCSFGSSPVRTYQAEFSRAVQVFPGVKVRVLGVNVGMVTDIRNSKQGVLITFRVEDEDVKLPADVQGAIVPQSLLGERFIQLFPSYQRGPELPPGATIPLSRTAVPSEPDELLRALQDFLGKVDSDALAEFVTGAADVLQGNGEKLNQVIQNAAGIVSTLSAKRDDLADLIGELNTLTLALSTRQQKVGRLIETYNAVAGTLVGNRAALEGTVTGLNELSIQLASLLIEHRTALDADIDSLTKTGRTLDRNVEYLALANRWSKDLFSVIERSWEIIQEHEWVPLNNQGDQLGMAILDRLQERLIELCMDANAPQCSTEEFWAAQVPSLFCFEPPCRKQKGSSAEQLAKAIDSVPAVRDRVRQQDEQSGGSGSTDEAVKELLRKLPGGAGL